MKKRTKILWATWSLALLLGSCRDKEKPEPASSLTARAGTDLQVKAGDIVNLDGSASSDSQGKPFSYQWAFTRKPANTAATLSNAATAKPAFTPDLPGEYEVELTIRNAAAESRDRILVTVANTGAIELSAMIDENVVLEDRVASPGEPDYLANTDVAVTSVLTVKPGVIIAFARDTRLEIRNGGTLIVKGDATHPVRLQGKEDVKGYWAGITFYSGSPQNILEWAVVSNTGSKPLTATVRAGLGVMGTYRTQLAIRHSVFEKNQGYGLYAEKNASLEGFEKNTFRDNAEAGVLLNGDNVEYLDENSTFSGNNGRNVVEIYGSQLTGSSITESRWYGFKDKTPYRLLGNLSVDAAWMIAPGVTIEMSRDGVISVDGTGYIHAVGTKTDSIRIRSIGGAPAFWRSIISYSPSMNNRFEYASVSGGGSVAIASGKKASIAVYGQQSFMDIRNSNISQSGGYGVYVNHQGTINGDVEAANRFEGNAEGKLYKE